MDHYQKPSQVLDAISEIQKVEDSQSIRSNDERTNLVSVIDQKTPAPYKYDVFEDEDKTESVSEKSEDYG